jgi:ubiquinone/menaquinone biosynthesis C-methylase UbiE
VASFRKKFLRDIASKIFGRLRKHDERGQDEIETIKPQDLIGKYSIEELCKTADDYYKSIIDPTPQMGKPFTSIVETPEMLMNMGLLLAGMHLGKTMTVLDFGAGTCWFSRFLNQMQCSTISCDASATALELGKRLFREYPIVGDYVSEPIFLMFDGRTVNLPDNSVDRIICFDTFHHIPNQKEILSEFARILKDGGIAGCSEPGNNHSQSPQSQYEMVNYKVLENDIVLPDIIKIAKQVGFTECSIKSDTPQKTIFFLHKGPIVPDSRSHIGLSCVLQTEQEDFAIKQGEPLTIAVKATNTGTAKWLFNNIKDIGVVMLGAHLYDSENKLLNLDFSRSKFNKDILPGETVVNLLTVSFQDPGKYKLSIDLVDEAICWFENAGSKPLRIDVLVQ